MKHFKLRLAKIVPKTILFIIVLVVGTIFIFHTKNRIERKKIESIKRVASTTESLISYSLLDSLTAYPNDTLKKEYHELKNELNEVIRINSNARFCYFFTLRDENIYFMVDSEPALSEECSPAGQQYTEADSTCYYAFTNDTMVITDAVADRWGTWISVYVPVHDPETGKVVAVFGMDFDAKEWNWNMFYEIFRSTVVVVLVMILFFFILIIRSKNNTLKTELQFRKNTEFALRESENKYRQISDKMTDVVWLLDFKGKSLFVSPSIFAFTGYTVDEYMQQTIQERFTAESTQRGLKVFNDEIQGFLASPSPDKNHSQSLEMEYICKDGNKKWGELIVTPYLDESGTLIGIHGVTRDITGRKNTENELIKAKLKAEESDRLKSAFLSNMSHEIRTPMNGIMGFASLLKRPDLSGEKQSTYINLIEKSGLRMLNIINDIIDISKIESGQMNVYYSETSISGILDSLYNFFLPEANSKSISLVCKNNLVESQNLINTDNDKLYAILTNLIKNSIKFTKHGEIEFGCSKIGNLLEFYVKDTGKGITPDLIELIFDRFRQGSEAHNREYEGSGLGLAISKAYIEMLGGKISVESEPDKGSKFIFTITYNKISEKDSTETGSDSQKYNLKGLNILIAEDNEIAQILLETFLSTHCNKLLIVQDGRSAIDACRLNPDLDLILMDMKMPVLSGFEATEEIRKFNKDVIIIAQTAFAINNEKNLIFDVGCNDYIAKPYTEDDILGIIKKWITKAL